MIGQTLGHYRIVEKIGEGGMGVVYRAHDEPLDRDVAVKVLPKGTLADETARKRFRKEALALSKLSHPHVATIFDFDSQDGVDFLAMEYLPGETLSERIGSGPIPEKEIARLGRQLVDGLAAAHTQGLVHRDLKPGNVRITPDGLLKILDFGLATTTGPVGGEEATRTATEVHGVTGTLPYMAPEQLRGEPLDARTDIYAAGVVLYEMATGQRPFESKLPSALIGDIQVKAPTPPSELSSVLSSRLEEIILKCLEKDPENRYPSAKQLLVDLRRLGTSTVHPVPRRRRQLRLAIPLVALAVVVIVTALLLLSVGGLRDQWLGAAPPGQITSLAVLPLDNLSGDPEQEYLVDGLTEALITDLSKIGALSVISRTSAMRYKDTEKSLPEIARELNVDGIVEGSVLRVGDRVRITTQLIHAATDMHLWAERYERDLQDVLLLQSEVAGAIAREIRVAVTPEETRRLASARPINPDAHEAYLKGRYHGNRATPTDLRLAIDYFQQAIDTDPDFALPYAHLAFSFVVASGGNAFLYPRQEALEKAKAIATKALEINPEVSEAYTSLGAVLSFEWDWSAAERAFKQALALNPGSAFAHVPFSMHLSRTGRHQQALAEIRRAVDLDPLNLRYKAVHGLHLYNARQYDEAIQQLQTTLALSPDQPTIAHRTLGLAYLAKKMYDEAVAELQEAVAVTEGSSIDLGYLGGAYAAAGQTTQARKILEELKQRSREGRTVDPHARFYIHAMLGDVDEAFFWLERSISERNLMVNWLKVAPRFDPLRSDPRFQALLRRMNFPE